MPATKKIYVKGHMKHNVELTEEQKDAVLLAVQRMVKGARKHPIQGFQNAVTIVYDDKTQKLLFFQEFKQFPPSHV